MKIYHVAWLMVLSLGSGTSLSSQNYNAQLGIKGGLNVADMSVDEWGARNMRAGLHAGLYLRIPVIARLSLQPEILYSRKGVKISYTEIFTEVEVITDETVFGLNYIDIPVLLTYHVYGGLNFHLGPYSGFLLRAGIDPQRELLGIAEFENVDEINRRNFNEWDFGLSAGLELDFRSYKFGFRYNHGFTSTTRENDVTALLLGNARNMITQVYIAISF
jgi:hypothetical protein